MPLAQQLSCLWNDRPGTVVAGLVLLTSLGSAAGGYAAHDQPTQPTPLPVTRPVVAPAVVAPAVGAPSEDASLVVARTRERDAALERVEQLEAQLDAALAAPVAGAPAAEPADEAPAPDQPAPTDEQSAPRQATPPPATEPVSAAQACTTAVGFFSDHDKDLADVIRGDNDARRTGHSLGDDVVALRTLSTGVAQPLSGLISAYAEVIAGARVHLLEHAELTGWNDDRFYQTGEALQDHCAVVSDPLA